jgi:hypothetical protein
MATEIKCGECTLRAKYDQKPRSFGGRFWRWHINFCPGWKAYMSSLVDSNKMLIAEKYQLKKYLMN